MTDVAILDAAESDHAEIFALYAAVVEEGGAFPRRPPADDFQGEDALVYWRRV